MKLVTKAFQDTCKTILLALNETTANLELITKEDTLYLNIANKEYFISIKYFLNTKETFHATVNANLFLNLIAGINTEEFDLVIDNNTVIAKAGRSSYKLPIIYANDIMLTLPRIILTNKTVEMPVSIDILRSILGANSKELLKTKNTALDKSSISEIQKMYYIDENGCFTFTTGATLNAFKLEKPIKLLLNERIVRLFKLFNTDVNLSYGVDQLANGVTQTKLILQANNIYIGAILINDERLFYAISGPCLATKNYLNLNYQNRIIVSTKELVAALNRLMQFTKNSSLDKVNMYSIYARLDICETELYITDRQGNKEVLNIENGSFSSGLYTFILNISDLKLVLDSCKEDFITISCGNKKAVVISHGGISNLLNEGNNSFD